MTERQTEPASSAWSHWYRRALPAYWIFLFCLTHFPRLRVDLPIGPSDKLAHFTAFALLAFLFWRFAETLYRPLSARFVWYAAVWLGLYATFDEWLQQFVGRSVDLDDWLCNLAGLAAVLALMEFRRRRWAARARRSAAPVQTPGMQSPPALP